MRRTSYFLVALMLFLIPGCSSAKHRPANSIVKITSINGTQVHDDDHVVLGKGIDILPASARYVATNYPADSHDVDPAITRALNDVRTLKAWSVCATELTAEADAESGYARAILKYASINPPLRPETDPEVIADRRAFGSSYRARAMELRDAAILARAAGIPCIKPKAPLNQAHFVILDKVTDFAQPQFSMRVSDYDVIRMVIPLEYHALKRDCASTVGKWLTNVTNSPIDKVPARVHATMNTFSMMHKAKDIARDAATLRLVSDQKLQCS